MRTGHRTIVPEGTTGMGVTRTGATVGATVEATVGATAQAAVEGTVEAMLEATARHTRRTDTTRHPRARPTHLLILTHLLTTIRTQHAVPR